MNEAFRVQGLKYKAQGTRHGRSFMTIDYRQPTIHSCPLCLPRYTSSLLPALFQNREPLH